MKKVFWLRARPQRKVVLMLFPRHHRNRTEYLFSDLDPDAQLRARHWFHVFRERWGKALFANRWRYPIILGRCRFLATHPEVCSRRWGIRMRCAKGGKTTQRLFRAQAKFGREHPALRASRISAEIRRIRKLARSKPRFKFLPIA